MAENSMNRRSLGVARRSDNDHGKPIRVLIVEDEYVVAMQMRNVLAEAGFAVVGMAATGEEALSIAAGSHPSLAIIDIRLGSAFDGVDLAAALFRQHGIRSVLATANYDEQTQIRAVDASPLGWLPKPFEMRSLVLKVQSAVRSLE